MDGVRIRPAVSAGLASVSVVIYLCLVGMVTKFSDLELVGEPVTMGLLMLTVPPLVAGFVVTRPRVEAGEVRATRGTAAVVTGGIAGATSGAVFGLAIILSELIGVERVREVFIQISPELMDFVTFGLAAVAAAVTQALLGTASGLVGGLARATPIEIRRPIVVGVSVTLLFALLQRIVPVAMSQLAVGIGNLGTGKPAVLDPDWLYDPILGSLTWLGAILIFVVSATITVAWMRRGRQTRERVRELSSERPAFRGLVLFGFAVLLVMVPFIFGSVISEVLGTVGVFMLLGMGLNIVVGYAGLLDLGYVAFFGFGGYVLALLTGATLNTFTGAAAPVLSLTLTFFLGIVVLMALAAMVGVLIGAPVLRLRGDYLAIVTLGLGEIVSILLASRWMQPVVGGPQGMRNITDAAIAGYSFRPPQHFYYLVLAFIALAVFVSWRLSTSRIGRAWNAMREDEQVAEAMGVSTTRFKLLAFAMGGMIGALGGALFAVKIGSLTPASFTILVSITSLAVVVLGGLGSLPGVIVGALVLIGLPGLLREFEEYRLLVYGAVLVAIMILRPQGLIPNVRRSAELHETDRAQDKWAGDVTADEDVAAPISPMGESSG